MSRRFSAAPMASVFRFRTKLGFTIVELLVVVAIIGILIAIILPSLGAARESARRTQCFNNLRNLGGATLNYVAAKQKYPPAATMRTGSVAGRSPDPTRHSFLTFLLPYFDQANLYQQIDLSQDWNSSKNEPLTKQNLGGVLLCPSAPSGREDKHASDYNAAVRVDSSEKSGIGQLIRTGLVQDRSRTSGPNWGNGYHVWDGILQVYSVNYDSGKADRRMVRPEDVKDGQGHTILIFESAGKPICYEQGRLSDCNITRFRWASPTLWMTINDVCNQRQLMNCSNNSQPYSFHSGGICLVKADNSVGFLDEQVEPDVMVSLITKSAGDTAANF